VTFIGSIDITSFKELRFLRQSQTLGITLKGIKQLLQLVRDGQRFHSERLVELTDLVRSSVER